jgi:hypothetical protein
MKLVSKLCGARPFRDAGYCEEGDHLEDLDIDAGSEFILQKSWRIRAGLI